MCKCLKHEQEYPQDGFCVYCGKPGSDGLGVKPLAPSWGPLFPQTLGGNAFAPSTDPDEGYVVYRATVSGSGYQDAQKAAS